MWEPTTKVVPELILEAPGRVWLSSTRLDQAELRLGREVGNDIILGDPTVSRRHALIQANAEGTHALQDLDSRNGTFINGQLLRPMQPVTLRNGDRIRLGRAVESLLYQNPLAAPHPFCRGRWRSPPSYPPSWDVILRWQWRCRHPWCRTITHGSMALSLAGIASQIWVALTALASTAVRSPSTRSPPVISWRSARSG